MDAQKVLEQPYVWDSLKRALRQDSWSDILRKRGNFNGNSVTGSEAIPLDVKIILFGDYRTYQLLQHYDPEFSELFRVTADLKMR